MNTHYYNNWRRDIAAEYVTRTGRAYPSMGTKRGRELREALIAMSDRDNPPSPAEAVDELIAGGLLTSP